jgi:hypothetical protein
LDFDSVATRTVEQFLFQLVHVSLAADLVEVMERHFDVDHSAKVNLGRLQPGVSALDE